MSYSVKLEVFEGPLDLLLHLIKEQEVDIYDIPISKVLDQYLEYLKLMEMLDLEVAGEFLVMAATLMLIKSKMLLPPAPKEAEEEEDPRLDLVQQLLEYKKFKEAAGFLETLELKQKNVFSRVIDKNAIPLDEKEMFDVSLFDLISAFSKVLKRTSQEVIREIVQEEYSVEERIADIIEELKIKEKIPFVDLFKNLNSKLYLVVTFLAILELIRIHEIVAYQEKLFGEIFVMRKNK